MCINKEDAATGLNKFRSKLNMEINEIGKYLPNCKKKDE